FKVSYKPAPKAAPAPKPAPIDETPRPEPASPSKPTAKPKPVPAPTPAPSAIDEIDLLAADVASTVVDAIPSPPESPKVEAEPADEAPFWASEPPTVAAKA